MSYRILIAEDEENLANALELNLRLEGYSVIPLPLRHTGKGSLRQILKGL
jgi:DNA-binding response OmpR family regulator